MSEHETGPVSSGSEIRVRVDGILMSLADAEAVTRDKLLFGTSMVRATSDRERGEVVYERVALEAARPSGSPIPGRPAC